MGYTCSSMLNLHDNKVWMSIHIPYSYVDVILIHTINAFVDVPFNIVNLFYQSICTSLLQKESTTTCSLASFHTSISISVSNIFRSWKITITRLVDLIWGSLHNCLYTERLRSTHLTYISAQLCS